MPPREEVNYFGAGPAPLPTPVLQDAAKTLLNFQDLGYGIAEMSHRSSQANQVLADAKTALAELLEIPSDYEILFMHGGGSGEFSAVVYHLVAIWVEKLRLRCEKSWQGTPLEKADDATKLQELKTVVKRSLRLDYLVTGSWSLKAFQEATRLVGSEHVQLALDAREHNGGKFGVIPEESSWKLSSPSANGVTEAQAVEPALTYYCDNETVDGVEFQNFPKSLENHGDGIDRMVVADMSSNFLSRKVHIKKYSVIFGGAQKNIGTTGVTIVIIRKSLLPPNAQTANPSLMRELGLPIGPIVLDFSTIAKNNSLYNTLSIFDVWVAGQVMKRLLNLYGDKKIAGQEEIANEKAKLLYSTIDKYPDVYQVVPNKTVRSRMNICLRVKNGDSEAEKAFIAGAEKQLLMGLKGHRSVGGIRISNYNAVSIDGVKKLANYLDQFATS